MNKVKVPIIDNPELLDSIISNIQKGLAENIGWLDYVFGRAERLVKFDTNNRKIYTPNVYVGGNEYMEISPSSDIGNFCFFWVDDPQNVSWEAKINVGIKTNFSLIFWFNFNRIYNSADQRNKEELKKQILDVLNGGFWLKKGRITVNRIYELSENIFRGFSLDETENQFLMQPYGGFRFEGMLEVSESCGMVIPSGIVFNPIFEEEGINSYNFTINGKEAVKGNSYPLGSNVVFDIYPVEDKEVENISVNGKVYEGDVIENGKRFVFTLLESPQNIVVNLVNSLVEVEASGRAFPIWNTKPGDDKLLSLSIHGLTEQIGTPTPANPVPMRSVGDTGLLLSVMQDKESSDYQLLNIKAAMKKAGHDGILRSVNGIYDEVVYNGKEWKLIQRIYKFNTSNSEIRLYKNTGRNNVGLYFRTTESNGIYPVAKNNSFTLCDKAKQTDIMYVKEDNTISKITYNINDKSNYIYFGIGDRSLDDILLNNYKDYNIYYIINDPIEYPLDLPVITTYDEQTYFASNAADVKPRMVAQCQVSEKLDYIKEGLLGYWTGRERSNTDENRDILPDLSGNGNDLTNYNMVYTLESGYGDGYIQYDGIDDYSNIRWTDITAKSVLLVCEDIINTKESPYNSQTSVVGNDRSLFGNISNGKITGQNTYGYYNGADLGTEIYTKNFTDEKGILNIYLGNVNGLKDNPTYIYNACLGAGNYYENPPRYACKLKVYDFLIYDRKLTDEEIAYNYKVSRQLNGELLL